MKILILTGSPHPDGTTSLLADEFCKGAQAAKHTVVRFDTVQRELNPCIACNYCQTNDGRCVYYDDGMGEIYPQLLDCDALVLVTPLYYFGMTAQLKAAIDRFYAVNEKLRQSSKQLYLLAACGDADEWAMDGLLSQINLLCKYLHWEKCGQVIAYACSDKEAVLQTDYPAMAKVLASGI